MRTGQDDYTRDVTNDPFVPGGYRRLIKGHPCHTPDKDIVLPSFEGPERCGAAGQASQRRPTSTPQMQARICPTRTHTHTHTHTHRYHASPFMGAPQLPRDTLLIHRGRMGERDLPMYSRGVRQKVCLICACVCVCVFARCSGASTAGGASPGWAQQLSSPAALKATQHPGRARTRAPTGHAAGQGRRLAAAL